MTSTWWCAVVLGGPVRPTAAALVERDDDDHAHVHSADRLDGVTLSEDEQARAVARQVDAVPRKGRPVVVLARAPGVGAELERTWRQAMPRHVTVWSHQLPRGADESVQAREDLVTAVHMARSRRQLHASPEILAALDAYTTQTVTPWTSTGPHDADPSGIVLPVAVAIHRSSRSQRATVSVPGLGMRLPSWEERLRSDTAPRRSIGDVHELSREAERRMGLHGGGSPYGYRISRGSP